MVELTPKDAALNTLREGVAKLFNRDNPADFNTIPSLLHEANEAGVSLESIVSVLINSFPEEMQEEAFKAIKFRNNMDDEQLDYLIAPED